jgi:hypothetical protein
MKYGLASLGPNKYWIEDDRKEEQEKEDMKL